MKFIANILTNRKFEDDGLYNIVSSKDDLIVDIPTLVIGWEYTKKLYKNANILDWKIDENTYWSFGNREKRQRYDETLIKFKELAINKFVKSIEYKFISLFSNNFDELNNILHSNNKLNLFIQNNMLYLSNNIEKTVYGISLIEYEYIYNNKNMLLKEIYNSNNVNIIKDNVSMDLKLFLKNHIYIIPYLC